MRCIPNIVIMTPSDERECQLMLTTGHKLNKPAAVRYPRGCGNGELLPSIDETIEIGKARIINQGKKIAILNFGTLLNEAIIAANELDATIVDMRFVKPLDETIINKLISNHQLIVTIEDNAIAGGAGSAVNEYILSQGHLCKILNIGLPDTFIKHGTQEEIHEELGLDSAGILDKIKNFK